MATRFERFDTAESGQVKRSNGNGRAHLDIQLDSVVPLPDHGARNAEPVGPAAGGGVDMPRVEAAVREMLLGLGENPDREGLRDTPARVARAYREILAGMHEEPGVHLARQFSQEQTGDALVILRDIVFVGENGHASAQVNYKLNISSCVHRMPCVLPSVAVRCVSGIGELDLSAFAHDTRCTFHMLDRMSIEGRIFTTR